MKKRKRCKNCHELFTPFNTMQKVCNYKCALEFNKKKVISDIKTVDKLILKKKQRESLSRHIKNTVQILHKYIRKRDEGKPCISCGTPYKKDFDAGHFYPAGKFTALKFDLDNIHGQCIQCNRYKEGNFEMYSLSLPNRIGNEAYQNLVKRANPLIKKWTREELKQLQNEIKKFS